MDTMRVSERIPREICYDREGNSDKLLMVFDKKSLLVDSVSVYSSRSRPSLRATSDKGASLKPHAAQVKGGPKGVCRPRQGFRRLLKTTPFVDLSSITLFTEDDGPHDVFQVGFRRLFDVTSTATPPKVGTPKVYSASAMKNLPAKDIFKPDLNAYESSSDTREIPEKLAPLADVKQAKVESKKETNGGISANEISSAGQQVARSAPMEARVVASDLIKQKAETTPLHPVKPDAHIQSSATWKAIKFEAQFTGFAVSAFLCYCVAHLTIYELIYAVFLEITDLKFQNLDLLYLGLLLAGLAVLRLTGFLWYFLSSKRYRQSKAEMKERAMAQSLDVQISDWIEEKPALKVTVEVVGFYLCYISLCFFWGRFLSLFFDQKEELYKMLPSTEYYERVVRDVGTLVEDDSSCTMAQNFDVEDYEFIYQNVAKHSYYQFSGSSEAPLYSVGMGAVAYVSAASLSIFCLSKVGFGFVDNW
ncbi:expressed unknown protein [Seminavis robusta]|uniref:Uncharacterized protein n=1 Tax=Seminavis robusta TaxID=568900 RepID=A0A9N8HHF5_9STRA|nr:expressed unknown protein [Seminavis robusta]|eukprot:Sro702_g190000.1 n/a (475) ;mRNA; f:35561-36985